VQKRLDLFVTAHIKKLLGPLQTLEDGDGLTGVARGIAFQIGEALGVLDRGPVSKDLKSLDQDARGSLRKLGVRFGAYTIYLPALLKPAPRALAAQLWALKHGEPDTKGVDDVPRLAASGRTSIVVDTDIPRDLYRAAGFRVVGPRAVRVDILERLADLIRPAMAYRPGETIGTPPAGAADGETFVVTVAMTSLAGCSGEDFASILRGLGYQSETREGTAITRPILMPAATEPVQAVAAEPADAAGTQAPVIEAEGDAAPVAEAVMADAALAEPAADAPVADVAAVDNGAPVASEPAVAVADAAADHAADGPVSDGLGSEVLGSEVLASEVLAGAVVEPAAEAAAPVTVEVWRMVRQPREHQHRARHGQRDGQREGRERGSFRKPAGERSFAPRGEGQPHGEAAPQGDARTGESKPGERRDFRPRHTRNERGTAAPREGGDNREQTPRAFAKKAGAPGGAFGKSGNPAGDMRGDRGNRDFKPRGDFKGSGDFRKRNDEPRVFSAQPPREKKADPDSPFAKLAALKAKLEGKE
ncbi:MAG: helicase-related protein, partial [Beijerinckiaceae bacterium]